MSAVHLHFSTWCEHVLHRRLGLESVHVDNLFDAVHPQAMLEQTKDRGKMNLNERSKAIRLYTTARSPAGMPHGMHIIPNT